MQHVVIAVLGCACWFVHWWQLFRSPDLRGSDRCQAVLPVLTLLCLACWIVSLELDPGDPESNWGGTELSWFWFYNLVFTFLALCGLLLLELPVLAIAHVVQVARRPRVER